MKSPRENFILTLADAEGEPIYTRERVGFFSKQDFMPLYQEVTFVLIELDGKSVWTPETTITFYIPFSIGWRRAERIANMLVIGDSIERTVVSLNYHDGKPPWVGDSVQLGPLNFLIPHNPVGELV